MRKKRYYKFPFFKNFDEAEHKKPKIEADTPNKRSSDPPCFLLAGSFSLLSCHQ
jgi:hypothetical protein